MNLTSSVTKKTEMHYGPAHQELFCFDISVLNSKVICIAIHIIFNESFLNIIVIKNSKYISSTGKVLCLLAGSSHFA